MLSGRLRMLGLRGTLLAMFCSSVGAGCAAGSRGRRRASRSRCRHFGPGIELFAIMLSWRTSTWMSMDRMLRLACRLRSRQARTLLAVIALGRQRNVANRTDVGELFCKSWAVQALQGLVVH